MATERQLRANRGNARRSTGPRTAEGKAASRLNALKHGILAEDVVLPNEDAERFAAFKSGVQQELQPIGEVEDLLVDVVVVNAWRLRRLMRVEKGVFIREVYAQIAAEARRQASRHVSQPDSLLAQLHERLEKDSGEAVIDDAEAHETALRRAEEAEAVRDSDDGMLGQAFIADAAHADALSKLSRYEAHIQRSMFRALNELQRLQAARAEAEVAADADTPVRLGLEEKTEPRPA